MREYQMEVVSHESGYCLNPALIELLLREHKYEPHMNGQRIAVEKEIDLRTRALVLDRAWVHLIPVNQ